MPFAFGAASAIWWELRHAAASGGRIRHGLGNIGMHRLFVAIEPPDAVKARLVALMGGIAGARWQSEAQLHLTLKFIGEVDRRTAEDVATALGYLRHPGFSLSLSGVGMFDRRGRPEALWVGVQPREPVKALHDKVEQTLRAAGIAPETRAYLPHITIARMKALAAPLDPFMAAHGGVSGPPWEVADLCLYESRLTRDGAVYTIVERYPLGAAGG